MLGLALLIFVAETSVVTLDTVRIIFVGRGYKLLSALMGLIVVSIWLFAIGQIMKNLDSVECFLAYAMGYTLGIWFGITIEEKLAIGSQLVRIITHKDASGLIQKLRQRDHGVTFVPAEGASGPVQVIFTIVPRKQLAGVVKLIEEFDDNTFYTVEDVRKQEAGVVPRRGQAAETLGVPANALKQLLPTLARRKAA